MGKKSGNTKGGRMMNPADKERKQQRAKELKRNKKQRTAVRHAIVKGRNPDELIEAMSRLDDQEFDPQRQLSLTVLQEKRNKLRASFYQIVGLHRQEKEEKRVKNLERMMLEYEIERARKEENFRAQMFSASTDFDEIPLPSGLSLPESAGTPFTANAATIGPQMPQLPAASSKAGILKKSGGSGAKKKHKFPPGPPPGLPPIIFEDSDDDEEEEDEERGWEEEGRRKRVRFGEEPRRKGRGGEDDDAREGGDDYGEEEDYAPVEIPEGLLEAPSSRERPPVFARPVPSLAAPALGMGPMMPGMATMAPPPPSFPPAFPMPGLGPRHGHPPPLPHPGSSRTGLISNYPPDPHPSAIISAEPQVVKPSVDVIPVPTETVISAAPQMRNITREATRFVPTAVKVGRSIVQQPAIGPRIPDGSSSVAGPTKLVPRTAVAKPRPKASGGAGAQGQGGGKSVDQACDDFLKELEGLL